MHSGARRQLLCARHCKCVRAGPYVRARLLPCVRLLVNTRTELCRVCVLLCACARVLHPPLPRAALRIAPHCHVLPRTLPRTAAHCPTLPRAAPFPTLHCATAHCPAPFLRLPLPSTAAGTAPRASLPATTAALVRALRNCRAPCPLVHSGRHSRTPRSTHTRTTAATSLPVPATVQPSLTGGLPSRLEAATPFVGSD
ncbi:unnamed protein product [Closterium sp. Naga37s-1]|nr:unnamed protein product [Closterium sp. Naga37s-1]